MRALGGGMGRIALATALLATLLVACAPSWKGAPHDVPFQRTRKPTPHEMPARNTAWDWWDHVLHSTVLPLSRTVSPANYLLWLTEGRCALDINELGQVPDSPWFENRIGRRAMTVEEIERGPNRLGPPADGRLTVISGKLEGATPGVVVRDSEDTVWFVKFDPPAYPDMSSGAESIASKLLHAAGYHVPETYIVDFDLSRLELAFGAKRRNRYNRRVPLRQKDLEVLLVQLNPDRDGRLRALFSRSIPGRILGPSSFRGVRADDPNDRIPHERRRSLRGLGFFYAWVNNTDARRQNTLDTFIPVSSDERLGYVRHYLLDFGDSLGAGGTREKYAHEGYEPRIDWAEMGKRAVSLGLRYPYWFRLRRSPYRSVGIFESDVFDPARWSPQYPNAAFREATARDKYWAASILARFTPELVEAAVGTAEYSEPGAARWVTRVLLERREKLLRHAFASMLALDGPTVEGSGYALRFTDLEVESGLIRGPLYYRWRVRWNHTRGRDRVLGSGTEDAPRIDLRSAVRKARVEHGGSFQRDPFLTLSIWRQRRGRSSPRIDVHLRVLRDRVLPVALRREVH